MLSMLGKIFSADDMLKFFSYFFQKTGFDISCKLSPMETICMKSQFLFSVKNKENINLLSAELAQRVEKLKTAVHVLCYHYDNTSPDHP